MDILLGQAYSFHQQGKRENQEDARWPNCDRPDKSQRFFVVCDGVGGSEKGEIASQTVCKTFGKVLATTDFGNDFSNQDFSKSLDAAYDALDEVAKKDPSDMGTTLTFMAFHAEGCTLAHIGDSRIYQIRPSVGILYRSDDHSLVNQMVHSGIITPEAAEHHPQKNVITRYMSPVLKDQSRCMATVMRTKDVKAGDYFLMCTDGVLDKMNDAQIAELICSEKPDAKKIKEMANRCQDSKDNNTAFLIYVENAQEENGEIQMVDEGMKSQGTKKIPVSSQSIDEIESIQKQSKKSFITQLLDNIFSR